MRNTSKSQNAPHGPVGRLSTALLPFALAALLAQGCIDGSEPNPGSDSGTPGSDSATSETVSAVTLGTGFAEFVPAEAGGTVAIYAGFQGGFHLYASMRMQGMLPGDPDLPFFDPLNPVVTVTVVDSSGAIFADQTVSRPFLPVAGEPGVYELIGETVFLDISDCADLTGEEIIVTVEVTDADGATAIDSQLLVAVEDESCLFDSCPYPGC